MLGVTWHFYIATIICCWLYQHSRADTYTSVSLLHTYIKLKGHLSVYLLSIFLAILQLTSDLLKTLLKIGGSLNTFWGVITAVKTKLPLKVFQYTLKVFQYSPHRGVYLKETYVSILIMNIYSITSTSSSPFVNIQ